MPENLIEHLRRLFAAPADTAPDAVLLRRAAAGPDRDVAFELLLRRYADPVWRVCRAVSGNHHAAEDAFQAAFLALAQKAGTVRSDTLGGWLCRVAFHAALKARPRQSVAAVGEPAAAEPGPFEAAVRDEVAPLVHTELDHLPEKYRAPLVLCYLHGLTQAEAAAALGWPLGTVAVRVHRGSERLRRRLAARGVELSVGGVAVALTEGSASASPVLVNSTAGYGGTASPVPAVAHLTTGALSAMSRTKTKFVLAATAVIAVAVGGVTLAVTQPTSPTLAPPPAARSQPAMAQPDVASDYFIRRGDAERLKRVAQAFHDYYEANGWQVPADIKGKDGKPLLSWRVRLLPHLDQEFLYSQFKLDELWDSDHNKKLLKAIPMVYRGPRAAAEGTTHIRGFAGKGATFDPTKVVKFPEDFPDGSSNTIIAVEAGAAVPWTKPEDLPFDATGPLPDLTGPYADQFAACWGDGRVSWVRRPIDEKWMRLAILLADGQPLQEQKVVPGPVRQPTEREQKEAERLRKSHDEQREWVRKAAEERQRLSAELVKLGGLPDPAALPPGATVEQIHKALVGLSEQADVDSREVERLAAELEKRKKTKN